MEHADILIVGGGMVGTALAAALSGHGISITVLEQTPPTPFTATQTPDLRVSAISPASAMLLREIGAWEQIEAMRTTPYTQMQVWENNEAHSTLFTAEEAGVQSLGHIIENRLIQLALTQQLEHKTDITLISPCTIQSIDYQPKASRVTLDDGRVVMARLLIGADGARSRVREAGGIGITTWDYPCHALALTCEMDHGQQDITWQRFRPTGPQAFLPLHDHYASLVWYNTPTEISHLSALDDSDLIAAIKAEFPRKLGGIRQIVSKGSFPLVRRHAQHYAKEGLVLVGDAAHTIHPLAGQGVNLGFQDVSALRKVLLEALNKEADFADLSVLRQYEKSRRPGNLAMQSLMDVFCYGFGNNLGPLKMIRNLGLRLANHAGPVKKQVIRYALGLNTPPTLL